MTSSPLRPGASQTEELDYYKKQYEQLETDLAEFQASSKELEEQLEKDIDAAEKKERKLKESVEKLSFEVEEWKTKHKQAKAEANNAQNTLQKEITSIREQNRALQLKLRDIEVANDDYERQARNTTSSLEDLERKLNVAIERGVLLEVEVKTGDTEREALRIENQRLRDELGDLKVESEITLEKLRLSGKTIETLRSRKPGNLTVQHLRSGSPTSEASGRSPLSPTVSTPPPRSDTTSEVPTPPSPPLSDEAAATAPVNGTADSKTPLPAKRKSFLPDSATTPRPSTYLANRGATIRHSRGPSLASSTSNTASDLRSTRPSVSSRLRATASPTAPGRVARNESLSQMKSLRLRMQKIEERVQSARSKLPARDITPRASPSGQVPSSVTVRRSSKRESSIATGSSADVSSTSDRRESQSHIKRLSFGIPRPASRASNADRPPSRASPVDQPPSAAGRPASRLSVAGNGIRPASRASAHEGLSRPASAMSGAQSTMSGTPRTHRSSASVSGLRQRATESEDFSTPRTSTYSSSRRTTLDKAGVLPAATFARRQSTGLSKGVGRRTSTSAFNDGSMRPPPPRRTSTFGNSETHDDGGDIGETY